MMKEQKILLFDIETAPILGWVWGIWDQNVAINQIHKDWHVLSWSAKWLGEKKIMYADQRDAKNVEDDKKLLQGIWKLLDEADTVVTQNGKDFDEKKLNARFIINNIDPPSPFTHLDTLKIARNKFAFTSNKLEYLADKLCTNKKLTDTRKFSGFTLWKECLKGNLKAWKEMEKYNKQDVVTLEELYIRLRPYDKVNNAGLYIDDLKPICPKCGHDKLQSRGEAGNKSGVYTRYQCLGCRGWSRGKIKLTSKEKSKSLLVSL